MIWGYSANIKIKIIKAKSCFGKFIEMHFRVLEAGPFSLTPASTLCLPYPLILQIRTYEIILAKMQFTQNNITSKISINFVQKC